MEVLFLLMERRGQLVTREEIIEKLWGKNIFLDTDNAINLRSGKSAKSSRTIPNNRALSRPSQGEVTDL
jgi:DNA-binding response OmpR family regulator